MSETDIFISNLVEAIAHSEWTDASLSVAAGLNRRAVTDLREGRVRSPKLSTVFALARALNRDPGEMMGIGRRHQIQDDLAEYLGQYSQSEQERILAALALMNRLPA